MLIRDTVHGDIELSAEETLILDAPALQRMRGIKQLGTANLVYPGAVHTRFEHSLGTSATAHRVVDSVRRSGMDVAAQDEAAIAIAALLHDVTHVPFGHTLEDERRLFQRHDKGDRFDRLLAGGLGQLLDQVGLRQPVEHVLSPSHSPEDASWIADVVSSAVDADLLDYLRRDSLYTGLAQSYDDRVFRYFTVADNRLVLDMSKHGMTRPDAWSEVVQLLRMRYFLTERVYYHHTKVVAGAMISKAVELAVESGNLRENDLLGFNDWTLLEYLRKLGLPTVTSLIDRLNERNLLKRAYVLSASSLDESMRREFVGLYHDSATKRRHVEVELAKASDAAEHEIILYCPALTLMKEASALVLTAHGVRSMSDLDDSGVAEITALAKRHANLWRMYVFAPSAAAPHVAEVAADYFQRPSEHTPR